jgi:pimeloyl-ACP methyl ester carboxylesterase
MPRLCRFLLPLLAAFLLAPAAGAKAPAGDAFYTPPSPLPGKTHGDLIWSRSAETANNMRLSGSTRNLLVLYRSTGIEGKPVAESGIVSLPNRRAPKGGWPVITWAHGTTGLADQCAPTRMPRQTDVYANDLRSQFAALVKAGYAVVSADYEGLGTPGVHPYLVGTSEGRSVLDIVRAARKIEPRLSKSVAIMGHSQGGHAALWATALAPRYTPELKVRDTIAFAPASHIKDQAGLLDSITTPSPISALVASIFRGNEVADPSLHVASLLTDKAAALYPSVDVKCLGDMYGADSWGGLAPSEIIREGVDRAPLLASVDRNDPENLTIKTPVDILQGASDTTVFPAFTDQLFDELEAKGTKLTYKKFPGVDHGGIVRAARKDTRALLKNRLGR